MKITGKECGHTYIYPSSGNPLDMLGHIFPSSGNPLVMLGHIYPSTGNPWVILSHIFPSSGKQWVIYTAFRFNRTKRLFSFTRNSVVKF